MSTVYIASCCSGPSWGSGCPCDGLHGGASLGAPTLADAANWRRLGWSDAANAAEDQVFAARAALPARLRELHACSQDCQPAYLGCDLQQHATAAIRILEAALRADPEFHRGAIEEAIALLNKPSTAPLGMP